MSADISTIKVGLAIVILGLFFNVALGISFGVNEDAFKDYISEGVAAHPELHDADSEGKIWRYVQRAHFHAGGIAAFSLGLIILVMFSDLSRKLKGASSILISLSSFYPLAWLSVFMLAPSLGRSVAHEHVLTKLFTIVGIGGLLLGSFLLLANLFAGLFRDTAET